MKLNKYESRQYRKQKLDFSTRGSGLYVYKNHTKADLMLPKAAENGVKNVPPGGEFQGNSYFMEMVRKNELRLVRTLIPEGEKPVEEKLILDQADIVTSEGKVEHVVVQKEEEKKPLTETPCCQDTCNEQKEVLLNEDPIDGVDFLG